MMNVLKLIYTFVRREISVSKWKRETKVERAKLHQNRSIIEKINGRILILIPHADDEWIGCSQLICSSDEVILCNMDMSGDDSSVLHYSRYIELESVAKKYNRSIFTINNDKSKGLYELIRKIQPNYILLPYFIDWHREHIQLIYLFQNSLNLLQSSGINVIFDIAMYQVSLPIPSEKITHCIPMNKKQWHLKWNIFKSIYKTQLNIPYKRFSLNECINGALVGAHSAEVFSVCTVEEWQNEVDKYILSDDEIKLMVGSLGSLAKMRVNLDIVMDRRLS